MGVGVDVGLGDGLDGLGILKAGVEELLHALRCWLAPALVEAWLLLSRILRRLLLRHWLWLLLLCGLLGLRRLDLRDLGALAEGVLAVAALLFLGGLAWSLGRLAEVL